MHSERLPFATRFVLILALTAVLQMQAQPTLVSSVPANGATGVSPTASVVFTFSEAMDADTVAAGLYSFLSQPPYYTNYSFTQSWNASTNVLTCTPSPAFLSGIAVYWAVEGNDLATGTYMETTNGSFTTASSGSGNGTNAITTFSLGKVHHFNQTSAGLPTLDPATPFGFAGVTSLASNRTATSVTLTIPTGAVSNLVQLPPPQSEIFLLSANFTNLSNRDATFPDGNYTFFVQSPASNQTVIVNMPTTNGMHQPDPPHLTNYIAAQSVNPNLPFVLAWDPFPGGTPTNYIDVDVGSYGSPNPGLPGALNGTNTTFTIPAGTLQPNTNYYSRVGFFRFGGSTNSIQATANYRATYTEFFLVTTSGLSLTNPAYGAGNFSFDVNCSTGQTVTVEYKTNLTTLIWQNLLTTNSPGSRFHAVAPQAATNRFLFFRARNGP